MAAFATTREERSGKCSTGRQPTKSLRSDYWNRRSGQGTRSTIPLGQKIGQAEEILVNASDDPEYIKVKMGFLGPKTVLIPVHLAAADTERRIIELR
jgi:hypothetical protein